MEGQGYVNTIHLCQTPLECLYQVMIKTVSSVIPKSVKAEKVVGNVIPMRY